MQNQQLREVATSKQQVHMLNGLRALCATASSYREGLVVGTKLGTVVSDSSLNPGRLR
jgi:hypothetical protein